jgi:hypothetical protein
MQHIPEKGDSILSIPECSHVMGWCRKSESGSCPESRPHREATRNEIAIAVSRHEWYLNVEKFNFQDKHHKRKTLAFNGLSLKAWSSYSGHWRQMMKRGFEITADGVCDYIVAYQNSMSPTSVSTWVTAVKRYAAIKHGMVFTTLDEMMCRFCKKA